MADQSERSGEPVRDQDRQLFELLDRYVQSLHCDDVQTRSGLLQRHPELDELLKCLNTLEAMGTAERIRGRVADRSFHIPDGGNAKVTLSIGVGTRLGGESVKDWIARADRGLYIAKDSGRNKVCTEEELADSSESPQRSGERQRQP